MVRLWYKDGNYMDVKCEDAWIYEMDPELDHTEVIERGEDGKWQLS